MGNDLDWFMRPVVEGCCKLESLKDGTLSLEDVAMMNDALDVKFQNQNILSGVK